MADSPTYVDTVYELNPASGAWVEKARMPTARSGIAAAVLDEARAEFQRVFTSHFYGHLEEAERARFLGEARRVARELVVVDSALHDGVDPQEWQERVLNDGSRWDVYKRYFVAPELAEELGGGEVLFNGNWFVVVRSRG
jgi:demethylmenaquinone methyltransferase/2-methoxy-6-polyprenyl-1,4-benzoquinol methylase